MPISDASALGKPRGFDWRVGGWAESGGGMSGCRCTMRTRSGRAGSRERERAFIRRGFAGGELAVGRWAHLPLHRPTLAHPHRKRSNSLCNQDMFLCSFVPLFGETIAGRWCIRHIKKTKPKHVSDLEIQRASTEDSGPPRESPRWAPVRPYSCSAPSQLK